jgi:PAS domain S-box-containing protein
MSQDWEPVSDADELTGPSGSARQWLDRDGGSRNESANPIDHDQDGERYRGLVENAVEGVYRMAPDGRYLEVNPALARMHGCETPSAFIRHFADPRRRSVFIEPAALERLISRLRREGAVSGFECEARRRDDSRFWMAVSGRAVFDQDGMVLRYEGFVQDVTDRRAAEQAYRENDTLFRHASRLANLGHWVWDELEDKCVHCSEELARIHAVSVDEYLARATSFEADVLWAHPDDRDRYRRTVTSRMEAGKGFDIEYRIVTRQGAIRHIREVATLVFDDSGELVQSLGTVQDITPAKQVEEALKRSHELLEQRVAQRTAELAKSNQDLRDEIAERGRIEAALRQAKADAERATAAKTKFLAAASHDLRQPLQALMLYIATLSETLGDGEAIELIDGMEGSIASADGILRALLAISELDAGVIKPKVSAFPIDRTLRRLETEFRVLASEKGLDLRIVTSGATVESDPDLLQRILGNLLSNGIRHSDGGRVLLGCRRVGGALRIEIWDSGRGIAKAQLTSIFEEFVQIDNPARERDKGLGLGLAIVDRLAQLLGHALQVRSTPGKGSCFAVEVALSAKPETTAEAQTLQPGKPPGFAGTTVLVIEDDAAALRATKLLLELWGLEVLTAASRTEALECLANGSPRPNLIIADQRLPGRQRGIEVAGEIRKRLAAEIPIIIVTGNTAPEEVRRIRAAELPCLFKPIKPAQLRTLMSDLLEQTGREASVPGH